MIHSSMIAPLPTKQNLSYPQSNITNRVVHLSPACYLANYLLHASVHIIRVSYVMT